MQEALLVAIVQPLQELPHEGLDVVLVEVDQARLQQPHQVMVHVLKHEVECTWGGADIVKARVTQYASAACETEHSTHNILVACF